MRILRLRVANFRGVVSREVRFAPVGVTIVEGPNEAGKSSLAEAIGVVFDHLDSTSKREVRAIQPVHRDVGAEVEIDVETGAYAFTYFKRFHKKPETTLRVEWPRAQSLTGRDAHERVAAILGETIDVDLWKALRIDQGGELQLADLSGQTRLSAALDAAAGSAVQAGEREESLVQSVRAEYLRYFTEGGKERQELKAAEDRLVAERARLGEVTARLAALESDVQRSAALRKELTRLETEERGQATAVAQHDAKVADLARMEAGVDAARARASEAGTRARNAEDAVARRAQLVDELKVRTDALSELRRALADAEPGRERAAREVAEAERAAVNTRGARDAAAAILALRQRDRTFRHEQLDLDQLRERRARVQQARADVVAALTVLEGPAVTDAILRAMQDAHVEVERARARLQAASPRVRVRAHVNVTAVADGEPCPLSAGEEREIVVGERLELSAAGILDVEVAAGGSAHDVRTALGAAEDALARMLAAVGVADVGAAAAIRDMRREAERTLKEREKLIKENLRDLTLEEMEGKVARLAENVETYLAGRPEDPPLGADFAESKRLESEAERELGRAGDACERAASVLDQARAQAAGLIDARARSQASEEHAVAAVTHAEGKLKEARASASDEALTLASDAARVESEARARDAKGTADALAAASPDETKALAANARKALDGARARLREAERELSEITGRLKVSGEEGLAEARDHAEATCARLELELAGVRARAAAARLLHETFQQARAEAQARHVAPLRAQVERLGRLVFGPTLEVELDEALAITSRTLGGVCVPFASLSGGTREQLGILSRLACAIVVSKDGGAPVIFDDALGYTDPERLEAMGAALALAGTTCQVIVLTCVPERYRHVGGAHVVRLG